MTLGSGCDFLWEDPGWVCYPESCRLLGNIGLYPCLSQTLPRSLAKSAGFLEPNHPGSCPPIQHPLAGGRDTTRQVLLPFGLGPNSYVASLSLSQASQFSAKASGASKET